MTHEERLVEELETMKAIAAVMSQSVETMQALATSSAALLGAATELAAAARALKERTAA